MRESVTRAAKDLCDHSQIVLRKITDIVDSTLPTIQTALEAAVLGKSEFRDQILAYMAANPTTSPIVPATSAFGDTSEFGLDALPKFEANIDFISRIPFSVLLFFLGDDVQKRVFTAIEGATYFGNQEPKFFSEGEIRIRLSSVRIGFLTTAEIFNYAVSVPTVEVGPEVNFTFNSRNENNGAIQHSWLPNPQNVSPIGSFAQVNSIAFGVLIDFDTAVKAYIDTQKGYFGNPGATEDPEANRTNFVNRSLASVMVTFLAGVSRGIGLYQTALSELINPVANILDEMFLEVNDLSTPHAQLNDRKLGEPNWLRFNISKISAMMDATIRGMNSTNAYDNKTSAFSNAMGALIRGFFYHKYKIRNLEQVQIETMTIPIIKIMEKTFEQIDRMNDHVFFMEVSEMVQNVVKNPLNYLQSRDQTSGYVLAQQNGVGLIQKTMILIAYTSLMILADSGSDRKYNQYNQFFGLKGGYKSMVKRLIGVLGKHLRTLIGRVDDISRPYYDKDQLIPIFRWSEANVPADKELISICSKILHLGGFDDTEVFYQKIYRSGVAFYSPLQVPFYPHYDSLSLSLSEVLKIVHSVGNQEDSENGEVPGSTLGARIPLENYVRPFFGDSSNAARGDNQYRQYSGKTLENYKFTLEELISKTESAECLDFGIGMIGNPVTQMFGATDELEGNIEVKSGGLYEEDDPRAEGDQAYVQECAKAVESFDNWVLRSFRKSQYSTAKTE